MKINLFLFLIIVISSCTNGIKKEKKCDGESKSVSLSEYIKKEDREPVLTVSPDLNLGYPKDEATLKKWQQKVLEEADEYYYNQLRFYYSDNPSLQEEMIRYSEIMIKKHRINGIYILEFYDYVKDSESAQKDKLTVRAIRYLTELFKKDNEADLTLSEAGVTLSELYKEGIYVKKDTIIAEYLYTGGRNLDSIIQARKINNNIRK